MDREGAHRKWAGADLPTSCAYSRSRTFLQQLVDDVSWLDSIMGTFPFPCTLWPKHELLSSSISTSPLSYQNNQSLTHINVEYVGNTVPLVSCVCQCVRGIPTFPQSSTNGSPPTGQQPDNLLSACTHRVTRGPGNRAALPIACYLTSTHCGWTLDALRGPACQEALGPSILAVRAQSYGNRSQSEYESTINDGTSTAMIQP